MGGIRFGASRGPRGKSVTSVTTGLTDEQLAEQERYRELEGRNVSQEQKIVRELYFRYEKQLQRWRDYRNLFGFLVFIGLFLGVLYCQRDSETAYKVHSTIIAVVDPGTTSMQSTGAVYSWMQNLISTVWTDPVCGDGVCEVPFEYASYSTFGCQADCGKLAQVQNLTQIQIDLYYDFTHPVGSMPSSDLMNQASWNLCPLNTPYSTACYYTDDNQFTRLSGEQHMIIEDAPDGQWDLVVKRDIFYKISGAVRRFQKVQNSAYYFKVAIAMLAAQAEQQFEIALLQNASALALTPYWTYVASQLALKYPSANTSFLVGQMTNASCGCVAQNVLSNTSDSTSAFTSNQFYVAFNNTLDVKTGKVFDTSMSFASYSAGYCPSSPVLNTITYFNVTVANATDPTAPNITTTYNTSTALLSSDTAGLSAHCNSMLTQMLGFRANLTKAVQLMLVDQRLGDGSKTGKFAQRVAVQASLKQFLSDNYPELVDPIYTAAVGTTISNPVTLSLATMVDAYVTGPWFLTNYPSGFYGLTKKIVYDPAALLPALATRAAARVDEVHFQEGDTAANWTVPLPDAWALDAGSNMNYTAGQVFTEFVKAGLTADFMPDPSTPLLNDFQIVYNLANWTGNTTAYLTANLDSRAKQYVGFCKDMEVSCAATPNVGMPYACTNLAAPGNATISGNLSDISYRTTCEAPCDQKLDCTAVCECYGACGQQQICACDACLGTSSVFYLAASQDAAFLSVTQSAADAGIASANLAGLGSSGGRRLQQSTSDQLASVLTQVGVVKSQQGSINTQMSTLQAQVDRANALATQRATDQTLINLITSGNQQIKSGQAAIQTQLDTIIGQQNQALTLANQAAQALSSIQDLSTKQLAAQQALNAAVQAQLQNIKIATSTGTITIVQALAIWKKARRDQATTNKAAQLANVPCNNFNVQDNYFNLTTNGNIQTNNTARERNIGLTNRVIGGMLLNQARETDVKCPDSKFYTIQPTCTGQSSLAPYGVDPVFKPGTTSYNPSLDDPKNANLLQYYNCSVLKSPTYNVTFLNTTSNAPPFCAELFNQENAPYAFHSFPMKGKKAGFPIWIDINLGAGASQAWFTYIQEGLYLDTHTRSLTVELVTYNAPLRMFGYYIVDFDFAEGGSIDITQSLYTTRVELYDSTGDWVRFAFEIILNLWVGLMFAYMVYCIARDKLSWFTYGWNWVDLLSNCLLVTTCIMWWCYVELYAEPYEISLRYDVYPPPLQPTANFLALYENGVELGDGPGSTTVTSFHLLQNAINFLNWYFALNGINILFLIARMLRLMDFQPRLGVVTRSLWLAGPDLVHFAIVAGMVFIGYAMMGHLIFGNAVPAFHTFGSSINTCFQILLGDISVNDDLRALGGLQSVAGALFFWTYELLVFMVLLNFLLAIIVDAFSEVKSKTEETAGMHTELYHLFRDKFRSVMARFSHDHISDAKLRGMLKTWAGEDYGNTAVANQNVDKILLIMNEELSEDQLRECLEECRKDAGDAAGDKAKQQQPEPSNAVKRALSACFGGGGKQPVSASPEEISLAAHYIVDRFGKAPVAKADRISKILRDIDNDNGGGGGDNGGGGGGGGGVVVETGREAALEQEREQLATALERLAEVQRELAEGQRSLMAGQKQLTDQQGKLVALMNAS